jgi:hypothetical protein
VKNRGDEPIHDIYMEMTKRNFPYSYLKQTKMFFSKVKDRKVKQILRVGTNWRGGET